MEKSVNNSSDDFNIYLCLVGTIFLSELIYDIYQYINTIEKCSDNHELVTLVDSGDKRMSMQLNSLRVGLKNVEGKKRNLTENYLFSSGRHSGSFFLKVAASIFCFGHLIPQGCCNAATLRKKLPECLQVEKR